MKSLLLIIALYIISPLFESQDTQEILQEVLNIKEFSEQVSSSPRFVGSQSSHIVMLQHEKITENVELVVNQLPIKIVDSAALNLNEKKFYIAVAHFEINHNEALLSLEYQNARLLLEENKKIVLSANLEKTKGSWEINTYKMEKISISD